MYNCPTQRQQYSTRTLVFGSVKSDDQKSVVILVGLIKVMSLSPFVVVDLGVGWLIAGRVRVIGLVGGAVVCALWA